MCADYFVTLNCKPINYRLMQHIQGEERKQLQIFCLEQMVAPDSFVRVIDFFVDSIDLAS